jgi:GDP/UDP-N,N'-diacetylbacillosamine 2-epimerase (hydrolysing)
MKKICFVTGSRAEYGLLKPLMWKIKEEGNWKLQLIVTGMHLSHEFGNTYKQIEQDGFFIDKKVEMLLSADTGYAVIKSMGVALIGMADALEILQPDLLIVLGDRFEILATVEAALILKIPVAHLHGGEVTEGAYDDAMRNAITKMSHLHFAATESYRKRIVQMGENPDKVFTVGAIGLDSIHHLQLLGKDEFEATIKHKLQVNNYLITFHPETLASRNSAENFKELLTAIKKQAESFFIFTKANADNGGREINVLIDKYVEKNPKSSIAFTSMGQRLYLSAMQYITAVVGNSSSGILEAPSFKIATINIGNRQKGRIQAGSVVNCTAIEAEILNAFKKIKEPAFKAHISTTINPYGDGNTSTRIINILKQINLQDLPVKKFFDLNHDDGLFE